MAKSTPVPGNEEIRRTIAQKFEEHRKVIVGGAVLAVVLLVGIVLYVVMSRSATKHNWHEIQQAAIGNSIRSDATLREVAERGGSDVRQNALLSLAVLRYNNQDYAGAIEALDKFDAEFGDSYLATLPSPDQRYPLATEIRRRAEAELEWRKSHSFENPTPDTSRIALVETTKGDFWLGFFPEHAPEHVKTFIEQAKRGAFNGTKVYSVTPQVLAFGGAATRDDDPANDAEPETTNLQDPEPGRFRIQQTMGRVSAVAYPEGESKSRFTVVASRSGAPSLDKKQTVFAEVLRDRGTALSAIDAIKNVVTYGKSGREEFRGADFAKLADQPVEPVVIERVSIWADGKIVEGHDWDTSAVTPPEKPAPAEEGTDGSNGNGGAETNGAGDGATEGDEGGATEESGTDE